MKREIALPGGELCELEYYLVSREEQDGYGMGIKKRMRKRTGEEVIWEEESDQVDRVTESRDKALKWLQTLADNTVMPICLAETLDDLVTQDDLNRGLPSGIAESTTCGRAKSACCENDSRRLPCEG